jgi:Ca2+/Na+ antiporter
MSQEEMMNEEGMALMEEKPESAKKLTLDELCEQEEGCLCCCCICHCSVKETKDLGCCGCFPIKCGVVAIGIVTIALFTAVFAQVFYCLLNDQFAWWYVLVAVILLVPFFIGVCFFISYYAEDTDSSRSKLFVSCQFVIYSSCALGIWNTCYILWCYKFEDVSIGSPDQGYFKQTKKSFIVWSLFLAVAISFLWAYFLCVCRTYSNSLNSEEQLEKERLEQIEKDKLGPFGVKLPEIPKVPGVGKKDDEMMMDAPEMMEEAM